MLIRILPDQITKHWEIISFAVINSLPPYVSKVDNFLNNILTALMLGKLECWVILDKDGGISAVATTQILFDEITENKTLLIFSIYGFKHIEERVWAISFKTISKYAKNKNCQKICCYTDNDKIVEITKSLKGDCRNFISFNL